MQNAQSGKFIFVQYYILYFPKGVVYYNCPEGIGKEREVIKMTRYMVFVANTIDSSFDTIEEAESRVNEILTKHPYAVGMVHITEERI